MTNRPAKPNRMVDLLPSAMAEDEFMRRFVTIFDDLHADVVARVDGAGAYFDAGTAPDAFVRLLASWTNLPIPGSWEDARGDVRLRWFVAEAAPTFRWRGTRRGLETLLRSATGSDVRVLDPGGVSAGAGFASASIDPVRIHVGPDSALSQAEIDALVRDQVPAGVPYEITSDEPGARDG